VCVKVSTQQRGENRDLIVSSDTASQFEPIHYYYYYYSSSSSSSSSSTCDRSVKRDFHGLIPVMAPKLSMYRTRRTDYLTTVESLLK